MLIFQCSPIRKSWLPKTKGKCLPNDVTFYVLAAITIFCDVVIFLLPIPLLMKIQINLRKKIALIGIFTLGIFTTACSIMRMVQIITIAKNGNSTMLVLWGTIEMNIGVSSITPRLKYPLTCVNIIAYLSCIIDSPHLPTDPTTTVFLFRRQDPLGPVLRPQGQWLQQQPGQSYRPARKGLPCAAQLAVSQVAIIVHYQDPRSSRPIGLGGRNLAGPRQRRSAHHEDYGDRG